MRFDKEVYFYTEKSDYNAKTGDYDRLEVSEVPRRASVNQTETAMIRMVYDSIPQESLTVRLQNKYEKPFDYIRIGKKLYKVDKRIDLYTKQQHGGTVDARNYRGRILLQLKKEKNYGNSDCRKENHLSLPTS